MPATAKKTVYPEKTKVHTQYRLANGERVIGVTTALGVLAKPALIVWANRLGLQGIDSSKYTDAMAIIGTIAHYLIECDLKGETPELDEYSPADIDTAENALISFYAWRKGHNLEVLGSELQLVSEIYRYGGTTDLYCLLDGVKTLVDFKTGSGIYDEHYYQVCAYRQLMVENGHEVDQVRILNIPRKESEEFTEKIYTEFDTGWQIFKKCLEIYQLKKVKIGG